MSDNKEKTFVLHDGQDEKRTDELHVFMGDVEWEGDNDGIIIWLSAGVGDTIVRTDDGMIGVRKKT